MSSTRRRRIQKLSALALLLSASGASLLPAAIFTVGSDGACTHATINNALLASLAAGADEIRIARNQAYTNLYIHLTGWRPRRVTFEVGCEPVPTRPRPARRPSMGRLRIPSSRSTPVRSRPRRSPSAASSSSARVRRGCGSAPGDR